MAANLDPILTLADLDAIPEDENRYELIEGELFVSRAPSLSHQRIVGNLLFVFKEYLRQHPRGEGWPGPGVIFSDFSGVIPDVVYLSNEQRQVIATGERINGAPELVIEILSPGPENERRDRQAKRQPYRQYGVKEYWIIDPASLTSEIDRTAQFKLVATLGLQAELSTTLLPGFRASVKDLLQ